jgi:hypothetical protein
VPYSCVPLFQDERIWQAASAGDEPGGCSWCASGCPWFLLAPHPQTLVVQDVLADARFAHTIWSELGWRWAGGRAALGGPADELRAARVRAGEGALLPGAAVRVVQFAAAVRTAPPGTAA